GGGGGAARRSARPRKNRGPEWGKGEGTAAVTPPGRGTPPATPSSTLAAGLAMRSNAAAPTTKLAASNAQRTVVAMGVRLYLPRTTVDKEAGRTAGESGMSRPGYLNRQSLLGEHRALHGVRAILFPGRQGYSRHPETLRWVGCLSGLAQRHEIVVAEMELRGYVHRTPAPELGRRPRWPSVYVTPPADQIALLKAKYVRKLPERIPLPGNAQELWASHKYSVMAREPDLYRRIGRRVARMRAEVDVSALIDELVTVLRERPGFGRLVNALEHMWGHVADAATADERRDAQRDVRR